MDSVLTGDDWVRVVIFGVLGLYLATSIPRLFRGRFVAGAAALVFWAGLLGATLVAYGYRTELRAIGERVIAVVVPGTTLDTAPREVTVFRQPDGQVSVTGIVSRARVSFILDTGASAVVLRAEDALRVGLSLKSLTYDVPVSTANGHAMAASVVLPSLKVGSISETDVDALVARPGALHQSLLGMTFLDRLASFTFSEDRVVLRGS